MSATPFQIQECLSETRKHIHSVGTNINTFIKELLDRATHHDTSKLQSPELEGYAAASDLRKVEYGSPEYKQLLEDLKPTIEHHWANNRHHPEHWPNGVEDMTLIDLIEMLSDWKAAAERNKNGNLRKSIEINSQRFKLTPQLRQILENTVRELFQD